MFQRFERIERSFAATLNPRLRQAWSPDTLDVAVPDAPTRGQEAREVRAYVRTWTAAHGVEADVVVDRE